MASQALIQKKRIEGDQEIVLRLLEHVEAADAVSQNRFAQQVGIAKGLANAYFNRCLSKGWIKLRQVPKHRFLYYLTPKGFAEKARLTAQFLTYSYRFYSEARADIVTLMRTAKTNGHGRLAVLGDGELAEIALIVSHEVPVDIVGFIASVSSRSSIAGRPVVRSWSEIPGADGVVLAAVEDVQALYEHFHAEQPAVPLLVPRQLRSLVWKKVK